MSLREQIANREHEQWSDWMKYLFSKCSYTDQGHAVIDSGLVSRWKRQMETPYSELPEIEKESDRLEADKILSILETKDG